jgi:hypothetical protein
MKAQALFQFLVFEVGCSPPRLSCPFAKPGCVPEETLPIEAHQPTSAYFSVLPARSSALKEECAQRGSADVHVLGCPSPLKLDSKPVAECFLSAHIFQILLYTA